MFKIIVLILATALESKSLAKCVIPAPDERTSEDSPPALIAYISKIDLPKNRLEVRSKSGKVYTLNTKHLESILFTGYGGAGEVEALRLGYELSIWQENCLPIKGKTIKPAKIFYKKPSWYENKD